MVHTESLEGSQANTDMTKSVLNSEDRSYGIRVQFRLPRCNIDFQSMRVAPDKRSIGVPDEQFPHRLPLFRLRSNNACGSGCESNRQILQAKPESLSLFATVKPGNAPGKSRMQSFTFRWVEVNHRKILKSSKLIWLSKPRGCKLCVYVELPHKRLPAQEVCLPGR